jgi:catechol 2,3-dioxygenase-like lactoylglutathione lyase family enzyme
MIKTKAIDHTWLWVRSLTEAKSYYEKVFGFECSPREGDKSTLIVESDAIHFFLRESKNASFHFSNQHLSFEVESLDLVIAALNEMGVCDYETGEVEFFKYKNYKWCEWKDPSGIRLECVEVL